jgi:alpha-ketoglutarate-dependent taurine dioxygenase
MQTTKLDVQPISGALGAEVHGIDLGQDLEAAVVAEIRSALLEHGVIFFRDQEFDARQHKALARRSATSSSTRTTTASSRTRRSSRSAASPATRAWWARSGTRTPR